MKLNNKKIICVFLCAVLILSVFAACTGKQAIETTTTTKAKTTTEPTTSVVLSQDTIDLADDTKDAVNDGKNVATDELPDSSAKDETTVEDEQAIEQDALVEQENISYDGTNTGKGKKLLGGSAKLTYYSQADSRWASKSYTSTGNKTQTIKSSGCGPTSAAMVVSSSKGIILPTTMAQLFVDNGYRTRNSGTAWACWSFIADYFDFNEYYTTSSFAKMQKYLSTGKYFVVASCGSGLFTSSGHYIVLISDKNGKITVYDPYQYSGKYSTASRKAANVTVKGNSVVVSEKNFKKYANVKNYWIFSNDSKTSKSSTESTKSTKNSAKNSTKSTKKSSAKTPTYTVGKTYTLKADLKVRTGAGTKYAQKKRSQLTENARKNAKSGTYAVLKSGTKVTVKQVKKSGSDIWLRIPSGWIAAYYSGNVYVK